MSKSKPQPKTPLDELSELFNDSHEPLEALITRAKRVVSKLFRSVLNVDHELIATGIAYRTLMNREILSPATVRNAVLNEIRRQQREYHAAVRSARLPKESRDRTLDSELIATLFDAAQLTESERDLLTMRYVDSMSFRDLAAYFHTSVDGVRQQLYSIHNKITQAVRKAKGAEGTGKV